jgi:hypothetical protein
VMMHLCDRMSNRADDDDDDDELSLKLEKLRSLMTAMLA